jgi:hypothetical protein
LVLQEGLTTSLSNLNWETNLENHEFRKEVLTRLADVRLQIPSVFWPKPFGHNPPHLLTRNYAWAFLLSWFHQARG